MGWIWAGHLDTPDMDGWEVTGTHGGGDLLWNNAREALRASMDDAAEHYWFYFGSVSMSSGR